MELCGSPEQGEEEAELMASRTLRYIGLKPRTVKAYKTALKNYFAALEANNESLPSDFEELDLSLAERLDQMFQEGEPLAYGGHLMSAIKRFYPGTRIHLWTAKQFYSNWRSCKLVNRALPLPGELLQAMAAAAAQIGQWRLAATLLIAFYGLLRTNEAVLLAKGDINLDLQHDSVVVALPMTKTSKNAMESVVVRDWLLASVLRKALAMTPEKSKLYGGSAYQFRKDLVSLQKACGFESAPYTPYGLRRGGATWWWLKTQSLDAVVVRGRWQSAKTARIYLDDARAELARFRFTPEQLQLVSDLRRFWSKNRGPFHR